jgi:hypothetical protein
VPVTGGTLSHDQRTGVTTFKASNNMSGVVNAVFQRLGFGSPGNSAFTLHDHRIDGMLQEYVPRLADDGSQMVMLREIVEKNNGSIGTVKYSQSGKVMSIEVKMPNARSVTYNAGWDFKIVNGKALIPSGRLMSDFGLTAEQVRHEAGDPFSRQEDAVMAFALMYHPVSMSEGQEYSANIDKRPDGSFTFDNIMNSAMRVGKPVEQLSRNERNIVDLWPNENTVGLVHTHWHPRGHLGFSPDDLKIARAQLRLGNHTGDWYLVNRRGEVKHLTPNARGTNFVTPVSQIWKTNIFKIK